MKTKEAHQIQTHFLVFQADIYYISKNIIRTKNNIG